jgi:capsular polysaccharide biosynthesis protein
MELREYWHILRRRWWLPLLLAALVGLFSLAQLRPWQAPPPSYVATLRVLVGALPLENTDHTAYDPRYYAWLTSEYLVDDFTEVVRGNLFARAVSNRLADASLEISPGLIQGSASTAKKHRIMTLQIIWPNREELNAIAQATVEELSENAAVYFQQLGDDSGFANLLDGPYVAQASPDLRRRLEFPLRVGLAFLIGVGLVFLWAYLDDSVQEGRDLEAIGLSVLGQIPRHR